MIVSSGTVFCWVNQFAQTPGNDRLSQETRAIAQGILAQLDHPIIEVHIPFRIGPWVGPVEAIAWLKQVVVVQV